MFLYASATPTSNKFCAIKMGNHHCFRITYEAFATPDLLSVATHIAREAEDA